MVERAINWQVFQRQKFRDRCWLATIQGVKPLYSNWRQKRAMLLVCVGASVRYYVICILHTRAKSQTRLSVKITCAQHSFGTLLCSRSLSLLAHWSLCLHGSYMSLTDCHSVLQFAGQLLMQRQCTQALQWFSIIQFNNSLLWRISVLIYLI